jgi:uncharacterized repeat protein (TIGR03803 family)
MRGARWSLALRCAALLFAFMASANLSGAHAGYAAFYGFPGNGSESPPKGAEPTAALTSVGTAFYGTTSRGGSAQFNGYGGGVVFKIVKTSTGYNETVLHAFTGGSDGIFPGNGNPVLDLAGNVYGTTNGQALYYSEGISGCGSKANMSCDTVWEVTPTGTGGTWQLLHRFTGGSDGIDPQGGLLLNNKTGALYGTTMFGANKGCSGQAPNPIVGCGIVFQLTKSSSGWAKTNLHIFTGDADGGLPAAALVPDPSGNGVLYGTTSSGGSPNCNFFGRYCGVVFKLTPTATPPWTLTVLYSFSGHSDGAMPLAAMVIRNGVLYGTTSAGGDYNGYGCGASGGGTVFALNIATKKLTTLYEFKCGSDGGIPLGNVALDSGGNVYGTTSNLGANTSNCGPNIGCGTVFRLAAQATAPWPETHLHVFGGTIDGGEPEAGLTLANSLLYGTVLTGVNDSCTIAAFAPGCGGLFSVSP